MRRELAEEGDVVAVRPAGLLGERTHQHVDEHPDAEVAASGSGGPTGPSGLGSLEQLGAPRAGGPCAGDRDRLGPASTPRRRNVALAWRSRDDDVLPRASLHSGRRHEGKDQS